MQTDGGRHRGNLRGIWQDVASYRPLIPGKYSRQIFFPRMRLAYEESFAKGLLIILYRDYYFPRCAWESATGGNILGWQSGNHLRGLVNIPKPWPASSNPADCRRRLEAILESKPASWGSALYPEAGQRLVCTGSPPRESGQRYRTPDL